ncbi:MAG: hypothetical protein N4A33_05985 [Bacteriovoracaceae bacterium]|nr:hypothetical protein [Bacteriovoracaceae bacterium]
MKQIIILITFISSLSFAQDIDELNRKIDILADEINALKASQLQMGSSNQSVYGLGSSASKVYFVPKGLSIGGYGEIVFNDKASQDQDNNETGSNGTPKTEALRNIIYLGYKYNDKWILNSEIEIEHVDEVYTEFLYIDYLKSDILNFRFGLSLMPIGLTNELHEPIFFNSVNRPDIEQYLIPTTWREVGIGAFGSFGSFDYKAFIFNGPDADSIASNQSKGIRKGRKKGGVNEDASTKVYLLNGNYNFNTYSSLGGSLFTGQASSITSNENLNMNIYEVHGRYKKKAFGFKFLYTMIDFTNSDQWNKKNTNDIVEKMSGFYTEFEYDIELDKSEILRPFVRYSQYNLNESFDKNVLIEQKSLEKTNTVLGLAYLPISQIIFKADYTIKKDKANKGINEVNVGVGFVY